MSFDNRPALGSVAKPALTRRAGLVLAALLLLGGLLYLQGFTRSALSDDEGGYSYAAWRISRGEVPYRDFLTPQMPAFVYSGGLVVTLFGRSITALRLTTMLVMLGAGCFLYATNRELFDRPTALLSLALFLVDANIFHNARFFRPEAYMLAPALAGIYLFLLGEKRGRPLYTGLAGACFGLAVLGKLFGALPLAGCYLYLLYAWQRERRPWRQVLCQGLALGLPVLLVAGTVALVFSLAAPYFVSAVFRHHTMQGAELGLLQRAAKALRFYWDYIAVQPLAVALAAAGAFLLLRRGKALASLPLWQAPTALVFLLLSRELFVRHLTYLAPVVATLAAVALLSLWRWAAWRRWLAAGLALVIVVPLLRQELSLAPAAHEVGDLAALIGELAAEDEQVVSDYAGYNFAAGRRSTFWAAGMSEGAAHSGQITGTALIKDIEGGNVSVVLINTLGRGRQMVDMVEYAEFRRYVQEHFYLVAKVPSGYRQFEVYSRRDAMPVRPDASFHGEARLTGLRLSGEAAPGAVLGVDLRWQALRPMAHDYHVSLRLVDASGHVWAQDDDRLMEESSRSAPLTGQEIREQAATSQWAPGQVVLQQHELPIPEAAPPGDYYLIARLYDPATGIALPPGQGEGARLPGGDLPIARVPLAPAEIPPEAGGVPVTSPLQARPAEGLEVVGGSLPTDARAGRELALTLLWRAPTRPGQDYRLRFSLLAAGRTLQQWTVDIASGLPTSAWREGEVVLGSYLLPLPDELPEGMGALRVEALDGAGEPAGAPVELAGSLALRPRLSAAALRERVGRPLGGVSFGEGIGLLGYDLAQEALQPGESLGLTLYWECLAPLDADYKVFVHLLDGNSQIRGQSDAMPDSGEAPTSGWRPGDALADRYQVPLQPDAPPGDLHIAIGFYDPVTGERLPLLQDGGATGQDHIILPVTLSVR